MSFEPIWVARRMRWLSPPESVAEERSSVRYPTPTSSRKLRRSRISRTTLPAICISRSESVSSSIQTLRSETDRLESWSIGASPRVTARASGRSRRPPHTGQAWTDMYFSISARTRAESLSLCLRSSRGMTPSKLPCHSYFDFLPFIWKVISRSAP